MHTLHTVGIKRIYFEQRKKGATANRTCGPHQAGIRTCRVCLTARPLRHEEFRDDVGAVAGVIGKRAYPAALYTLLSYLLSLSTTWKTADVGELSRHPKSKETTPVRYERK
jgi:hypothetical protein